MKIFLFFICGLAHLAGFAQPQKKVKPLQVGDRFPDITLTPIRNYNGKTLRLSQLRGKIVIFDFWGTNCPGCLQEFPKLGRLQKQFPDQLQIILVNGQTQPGIDSIFRRIPNSRILYDQAHLPSVTGDNLLHQMFPHHLIPHEVWIDQTGKVMAITDADEVTAANIERVLKHPAYKIPAKREMMNYAYQKAFLPQLYDSAHQVALYYSTLIRHIPGLWGASLRMVVDSAAQTIRMTRGPVSILELYGDALSQFMIGGNPCEVPELDYGKRVILEVADSNRYFYRPSPRLSRKEWDAENKYCYELVLPLADKDNLYRYMLQDLNRYFHIDGYNSKALVKCLAIVRTSTATKFAADESKPPVEYTSTDSIYYVNGMLMLSLKQELSKNNQHTPFAFVDQTGYTGKIQLELHAHLGDLPALKKELREKYDLDLVEKEVELEVMVIKERKQETIVKK